MKLLTFFAVAIAAGTMCFAANAQPKPTLTMRDAATYSWRVAKAAETKSLRAKGKTAQSAAPERTRKLASISRKQALAPSLKRSGQGRAVQKTRSGRQRIVIDTTTTASVTPYAGPRGFAAAIRYEAIVARYAASNGVPVSLAHAVIRVESNYRVNARGNSGEIGLMQIKPATARMMGYRGGSKGLFDPETNIRFGMKYLGMAHKLGGGATCATILRYNAGHAARRMNPVSSAYCRKVQREMAS